METDVCLLRLGEGREDDIASRIALVAQQVGQHHHARHRHPAQTPHRVERLRQIQPSCGILLRAQRQDKRIGRGLQKGQPEGEDIEREAEEREALLCRCRDEEESPHSIECQSQQDAFLVAVAADEQGRRHCHRGIAAIESKLYQARLCRRQFHQRLESRHHRVGDVVGESPQRKQRRHGHKRQQVFLLD